MVITGTSDGTTPIQETLAIPASSSETVATTQSFLTVISAKPLGGGWTAAVTLGTNGLASSPWKITNSQQWGPFELEIGVVVTGTVNYTIEYTYNNPNNNANSMGSAFGNYPTPPQPWSHPTLVNQTSSKDGPIDNSVIAWRATINSGTGFINVTGIEAGMH